MRPARDQWPRGALAVMLAALAVLASVMAAGSVPHTHLVGDEPALFNQEHDLSTLAAVGGGAPLPEAASIVVAIVVASATPSVPPRLPWRPTGSSPSRAPPRSA